MQGGVTMVSEDELDRYRLDGIRVRVERDSERANDIRGIVVAWDGETVLLRKLNRKLVKLPRSYRYIPDGEKS
jgi:hypothetical protein